MNPEMYKAITDGDLSDFENIIASNNWLRLSHMKSHQQNTILHIAAKYKKKKIAEKTLDSWPSLVHEKNSKGDSPLHIAARVGDMEMVRLVIERAKPVRNVELVKMRNVKGDTALHEAVRNGNLGVAKVLIAEDQQLLKLNNNNGESPLFIAVDQMFFEIARYIVAVCPDCSYAGRNGMNVLHAAIIRGGKKRGCFSPKQNTVRFLSHIFSIGPSYSSPHNITASDSEIHPMGDIRVINIDGDFIRKVHSACSSAIDEADEYGWIPLHYAAHLGNSEAVDLLLEFEITLINVQDELGMSALHVASKAGQLQVVLNLIRKCPHSLESEDKRGRTALHVAVESGNINVVKLLISTTSDIGDLLNRPDLDGNTPLHLAAHNRHGKIFSLLANDHRVHPGDLNNERATAFDIILSQVCSAIAGKALPDGYIRSLEHVVVREAKKVQQSKVQEQDSLQQLDGKEATSCRKEKQKQKKNTTVRSDEKQAMKMSKHASEMARDMANVNLIIATIIASVTFAAAMSMPGGYHDSDNKEKVAGMAILSKQSSFAVFVISNSLAFGSSTAILMLPMWLASNHCDKSVRNLLRWSTIFKNISILAMTIAFLAGTYAVLHQTFTGLAIAALIVGCYFFYAPFILMAKDASD